MVAKSYQNNEVMSIKKLLGVPNGFLLYNEITIARSLKFQRLLSGVILLHQPNLALTTARDTNAFNSYFYSENAI